MTRKQPGKEQQQILLPVKGWEAHPLLPQTSFTHTKTNICFCPINCFHMGGTHHTWLYSFQKSAFKVLDAPCPSWCLLSHHQADSDRFAEIAQSDSLRGCCPRGMRRCAGLQSNTGSEHTTEPQTGLPLWCDKRIKHQLNTGITTLPVIFWGWTTLAFAYCEQCYSAIIHCSCTWVVHSSYKSYNSPCSLPEQWEGPLHR